jgi:hypothetical protein
MPDYYKELRMISVTGVSATAIAATQIGTTENGTQSFHPLYVVFVMNAASSLTIAGAASVGTNSSTYNNVIAITTLTGLTTIGQMLPVPIVTAIGKIAANTAIFVNVTTGATGTSGTIDIHVIGFYQ